MTEAVADFRAEVSSSRAEDDGFHSVRILANEISLVFVSGQSERTIRLSDVFDISQTISKRASATGTHSITIGFRDGELRETARVRCGGKTLANFQIVLFRLLLDGLNVRLRTEGRTGSGSFTSDVTLALSQTQIRFETDSSKLSIGHEDVVSFDTERRSFSSEERQPVAVIYWADEQTDAKTTVVFPSFRWLNLFGRYMQSYTNTGRTVSEGTVQVLFVDDDAHDLEMAETMILEEEPSLSIESEQSPKAGLTKLEETDGIHCVVSDYDMPGTDGIEFLRQVRANYPNLPFILFTGQGGEDVAKQALLSDVTDYVEKGIGSKQYEILADRIRQAIR
jgi:CheY-like chemotaxis protein